MMKRRSVCEAQCLPPRVGILSSPNALEDDCQAHWWVSSH